MRDRIPASQTDRLEPTGSPSSRSDDGRITVIPADGACHIRSGQDWTDSSAEEREAYLGEVEPVLRAGMDFLI